MNTVILLCVLSFLGGALAAVVWAALAARFNSEPDPEKTILILAPEAYPNLRPVASIDIDHLMKKWGEG